MVVGLVSGTGAGLVETVRSTVVGCGAFAACFVSNESRVWTRSFEVSCALLVAVAVVVADEPCTASRSDLAASGGSSAEEFHQRARQGLGVHRAPAGEQR
jgi:hypothetical protein